jgi:hypothetical protein
MGPPTAKVRACLSARFFHHEGTKLTKKRRIDLFPGGIAVTDSIDGGEIGPSAITLFAG